MSHAICNILQQVKTTCVHHGSYRAYLITEAQYIAIVEALPDLERQAGSPLPTLCRDCLLDLPCSDIHCIGYSHFRLHRLFLYFTILACAVGFSRLLRL
uniref:HP2 n=1 Tax=Sesame deltaflexivirus 1 TaxID=2794418 RepID=A0A7T5QZA3_9VIRU|nr:HP2 [Sesame deltaflexivirus 1]